MQRNSAANRAVHGQHDEITIAWCPSSDREKIEVQNDSRSLYPEDRMTPPYYPLGTVTIDELLHSRL